MSAKNKTQTINFDSTTKHRSCNDFKFNSNILSTTTTITTAPTTTTNTTTSPTTI